MIVPDAIGKNQQKIEGMQLASVVAMCVFAMLFGGFFLALVLTRDTQTIWPPPSFRLVSILKPLLATLAIILSSVTLNFAAKLESKKLLGVTMFLGILFLIIQFLYWQELNHLGFNVETGVFASFLHALTWVHVAHIVLGLFFLFLYYMGLNSLVSLSKDSRVVVKARLGFYSTFWHFLTIVWFILLIGLFAPL